MLYFPPTVKSTSSSIRPHAGAQHRYISPLIFHGNVCGQGPGYSPSLGLRWESRLKPKAAAKGIAAVGSEEEAHPLNPLVRLAVAPTDGVDCRRPTAATGRGMDDRIGEHEAVGLVPDALQILVRMTLLDELAHSSRVSWKGRRPPPMLHTQQQAGLNKHKSSVPPL